LRRFSISILFGILITFASEAQHKSIMGNPFVENFSPEIYKGDLKNWSVIQNNNGVLFFGNGLGLLKYDGQNWDLLRLKKNQSIRSLALDSSDRIWYGASNDLGFMAEDSIGQQKLISLLDKLPEDKRNFGVVLNTLAIEDSIFFLTNKYLFCWIDNAFRIMRAKTSFHLAFKVYNQLYVREWDKGLQKLKNDSLHLVPNGDFFSEKRIYTMLPYGYNQILIGTRKSGLFLIRNNGIENFYTDFDPLLVKSDLFHAVMHPSNGHIFLGTMKNGVFQLNKKGQLIRHFNKECNLQDQRVYGLMLDRENALWLAMDSGISKIDMVPGYSIIDESLGLPGKVYFTATIDKKLLVSTENGLFSLSQNAKSPLDKQLRWSVLSNQDLQSQCMLTIENDLIIGTFNGLYVYSGNALNQIVKGLGILSILHSKYYANRVYIGARDGLYYIIKSKKGWTLKNKISDIFEDIRGIAEDENGNLWLGTYNRGIILIDDTRDINLLNRNEKGVIRFSTNDGLPANSSNMPFSYKGKIYIATRSGVFDFDKKDNLFQKANMGNDYFNDYFISPYLNDNSASSIWFRFVDMDFTGKLFADNNDDSFLSSPYNYIHHYASINHIQEHDNGDIWFSTDKGIIKYEENKYRNIEGSYSTVIKRISIPPDSLLFMNNSIPKRQVDFEFANNSIRFEFIAPYYLARQKVAYQSYLEGFDDNWSEWQESGFRNFNKLPSGHYIFRVRAKNIFNQISKEDAFIFVIKPPWYRSTLAYLAYFIIIAAFIYGFVRWRLFFLRQENIHLENIVSKRTSELKIAQEKLFQSEKMAALGELVAGVAHEINTPVGVGVTASSQLKENTNSIRSLFKDENISVEDLDQFIDSTLEISDILMTNLDRAAQLIQSFKQVAVDQSSDESRTFDLKAYIEEVVLSLNPQIKRTNHRVEVSGSGKLEVTSYAGAISQIISNFILNSIQHGYKDQERGLINIELSKENSNINITYKDDGSGIPLEYQNKIFNPFFTTARGAGGSGLGLHIVYNLVVQKLNGSIEYNGTENTGAIFNITIPISVT
jgi:signal transduction histidine kinase/ligand-binding sensor domain-containing protein